MTQPLNSALEVGIRVVAMLTALYPRSADLSRVVLLDYEVLHSGDFNGESSLHPSIPGRVGELSVKRGLVENGIELMGRRGLIVRSHTDDGIYYSASDDALPFLESIDSSYLNRLRDRCLWAARSIGDRSDEEIRTQLNEVFGRWAEEFDDAHIR
jgi:hypothetical protein